MPKSAFAHVRPGGQRLLDKLLALLYCIGSLPDRFHHERVGTDAKLLGCLGGTLLQFFGEF